ncbi:hypothetical protein TeGR_g1744 [Tetraparma gracilis]|uniref:S-adenosyl-L-methionine-dependent methyltransferase n=1 Tax=Tetraparma gracilis TaxID=2962635 RepID=A0ABQ6MUZ5_9STRA|nr:hypothetical protein TeGR_g1744 [Tetraparma gracilis]
MDPEPSPPDPAPSAPSTTTTSSSSTSLVADRRSFKLRLSNLPQSLTTPDFSSKFLPALLSLANASLSPPLPAGCVHAAKKASGVRHGIATFKDRGAAEAFLGFFRTHLARKPGSKPDSEPNSKPSPQQEKAPEAKPGAEQAAQAGQAAQAEQAAAADRVHTTYDVNLPLNSATKALTYVRSADSRDCLVLSWEDDNQRAMKRRNEERGEREGAKRQRGEGPITEEEARDGVTPLWREYLTPEQELLEARLLEDAKKDKPKEAPKKKKLPYHIYKKTNDLKKSCLTKVLSEVRGQYRQRIENFNKVTRNKSLPRVPPAAKKSPPTHYADWWAAQPPAEREAAAAKWKTHGLTLPLDFPAWTGAAAKSVSWCSEGSGAIVPSPQQSFYRNKCEFTFGPGEGGEPGLGFLPAGWAAGTTPPGWAFNVNAAMCAVAGRIKEVVGGSAGELPLYDPAPHLGFWRQVTVRTSNEPPSDAPADAPLGSIMIVIQHSKPAGGVTGSGPDFSAPFEGAKQELAAALTEQVLEVDNAAKYAEVNALNPLTDRNYDKADVIAKYLRDKYRVVSLVFQEYNDLSFPSPSHPLQVHSGSDHIVQRILDCRFKVSHGSFFQVNSSGADALYSSVVNAVKKVSEKTPGKTLLFDVCCGTGSIGLTCINKGACDMVVGVDIAEPAIENARENSLLNGQDGTTTRWVAGKAEDVMRDEIKRALGETETSNVDNFVAVVDPARTGLHKDVLKSLRNCKEISTLVYVSCNPTKSLIRDSGALCGPSTKTVYGKPFAVSSAQPVDMFPQTDHAEMIMVFER